ncbi:MAG TPA: oxygenase MpaB family protein [Nocardioidaceae bacterium]|nr:oxygenase MpaB family protein [Nocardioidaceae bacterium]
MGRWEIARHIATLDPEQDHVEIYRLSTGHEFPWDYRRALELALLRTFAVPSIAELLVATGEFARRPQRRYDDTAILMGELAAHGYDSERGRTALRRINRAHGHYRIANNDMLYVLSTFVLDPVRWIDRYGWRRLLAQERLAAHSFYREVGRRMNIHDIPETYAELERFSADYARRMAVTPDTTALGDDVLGLVASWYPRPVQGLARRLTPATFDDELLHGLGLPVPGRWQRHAAGRVLKARAAVVRRMRPRRVPAFDDGSVRFRSYPGYPDGYDLADLGAPDPPIDIDQARLARDVRRSG